MDGVDGAGWMVLGVMGGAGGWQCSGAVWRHEVEIGVAGGGSCWWWLKDDV